MKKKIWPEDLGINLKSKKESELFKWFLASLLFAKPIQQEVAKRTYFEFVKNSLATPEKILDAGWDKLVKILDQGHYVRYDFSTATKLQEICMALMEKYGGGVTGIMEESVNQKDLARRLKDFKGIGPITISIFLQGLLSENF